MTIVSTTQDPKTLTLTVVADLAAPPKRVWQIWADPRQLERWWGPPTWPARFDEHQVVPGGTSRYTMTGPAGETSQGWWRFLTIDEPNSLEFEDGFADEGGSPSGQLPVVRARVVLEESGAGTRMTMTSRFDNLEDMERLVQMGMLEGLTQAMGQIDDVLATT